MLQYYLRASGLALPWIGTGRFIFSHDLGDADFSEIATRFAGAARAMRDDGWWWKGAALTNRSIKRRVLGEVLSAVALRAARQPARGHDPSDRAIRP
jgi:glutamate-1-semialdehyde 2,1-aminomutase